MTSVLGLGFFSPLAIAFNEGPGGIFDFCMSSLLSACCWKMELEAVEGFHKEANSGLDVDFRRKRKTPTNHERKRIPLW